MSLYDDALAAGDIGGIAYGRSADPSRNLSPELLRQIVSGEMPDGYSVQDLFNQINLGGTGDSQQWGPDVNGPKGKLIYGPQSGSGFHTQQNDVWDEFGNYIGESSGDSNSLSMLKFAALAAGGYYGGAAMSGAGGGGGTITAESLAMSDIGIGAAGAGGGDLAALGGATSFGVAPQAVDATTALTAAETSAALPEAAMQTIEVVGSKLPAAGVGVLDVAAPIGGTLTAAELGDLGTVSEPVDPSNYSNEGRNYPTTESTQGRGGSPVNASQFPGTPFNDVNGNPITQPTYDSNGNQIVPPPNNNGGGTNPFGTGDFKNLFDVLSGLYGLKLAGDAAEKSDPFGPYRKGYADKLQALEANPGLIRNTPGFFSGQDAITRQMASKGYLGSGNQAASLQRFGGDFYNNEANRLATLAGANINPGATYFNQAQLVGQSLSNIGYGLSPYMSGTGGPR